MTWVSSVELVVAAAAVVASSGWTGFVVEQNGGTEACADGGDCGWD